MDCGIDDLQGCYDVQDVSGCGGVYRNFSDFPKRSCNYCTSAYSVSKSVCRSGDVLRTVSYAYTNSCCATTGLSSDCNLPVNGTEGCGYVAKYAKADFSGILVDGLGTAGAEAVGWIETVILVLIVAGVVAFAVKLRDR